MTERERERENQAQNQLASLDYRSVLADNIQTGLGQTLDGDSDIQLILENHSDIDDAHGRDDGVHIRKAWER